MKLPKSGLARREPVVSAGSGTAAGRANSSGLRAESHCETNMRRLNVIQTREGTAGGDGLPGGGCGSQGSVAAQWPEKKPRWLRVRAPGGDRYRELKQRMRLQSQPAGAAFARHAFTRLGTTPSIVTFASSTKRQKRAPVGAPSKSAMAARLRRLA